MVVANVIIIAGQSNAVGSGDIRRLPSTYYGPTGALIYNSEYPKWDRLTIGKNAIRDNFEFHGIEPIIAMIAMRHFHENVFIIKHATGGTGLDLVQFPNDWLNYTATGQAGILWQTYANAIADIPAQLGVDASQVEYKHLFIWIQGEQDGGFAGASANYQTNLETFFFDGVNGAVVKTSEATMPIVIARLSDRQTSVVNRATIQTKQDAFVSAHSEQISIAFTDTLYVLPDGYHYASESLVRLAFNLWRAWRPLISVTEYPQYSLGGMRLVIQDEFGLDTRDAPRIDRAINNALQEISADRPNGWPWQNRRLSIRTKAYRGNVVAKYGVDYTYGFLQDNLVAAYLADNQIQPRDILTIGAASGDLTNGYLVIEATDADGSQIITIDAKLSGATETTVATYVRGFWKLPVDCRAVKSVYDDAQPELIIDSLDAETFDIVRRRQRLIANGRRVFATVYDPLPANSPEYMPGLFLALYPFVAADGLFHVVYTVEDPKLVGDYDEPYMPLAYRCYLLEVAKAAMAAQLKETSLIALYEGRRKAAMAKLRQLIEPITEISGVQRDEDDVDFVPGPPNLPSWR